jgi:hypothetical protein
MNIALRILIIVLSFSLFFSVIFMLIKKRLDEPNSILWFLIALVVLLSGIFPSAVNRMAEFVGIYYQPAFVFLVAIVVLLLIVFHSSMEISRLRAELNEIAITVSILKSTQKTDNAERGKSDESINSRGAESVPQIAD